MINGAAKYLQRRCYTFLNTTAGFVLFILLNYLIFWKVLDFGLDDNPCR